MITSRRLADELLGLLAKSDTEWAFLHGEDRWSKGELSSDLDLAVSTPPLAVVRGLRARVDPGIASPILLWRYDLHSWTTFWVSKDLSEVVQLDLTMDLRGNGKYGIRTGEALANSVPGARWPTLDSRDSSIYLLSKRLVKGQLAEAERLAESLRSCIDANGRCDQVLTRKRSGELNRFLINRVIPSAESRTWRDLTRRACRLRRPTGVWIHVNDPTGQAPPHWREAACRIEGKLPYMIVLQGSGAMTKAKALVARLRPSVVFTVGPAASRFADVVIPASGMPDDVTAIRCINAALRETCRRRLSSW